MVSVRVTDLVFRKKLGKKKLSSKNSLILLKGDNTVQTDTATTALTPAPQQDQDTSDASSETASESSSSGSDGRGRSPKKKKSFLNLRKLSPGRKKRNAGCSDGSDAGSEISDVSVPQS